MRPVRVPAASMAALLWAYTWLCAASVGIGTIALFAVAGNYGQLISMLLFVYAGLASAGGTVPIESLPPFLRALSYVEPLRQVLSGTRSIMYFDAQANAGLARGSLEAALGLVFWLALGTAVVKWYDRKHFYRLNPDILAHVGHSVQEYKARRAAPPPAPPAPAPPVPAPRDATQSPSSETDSGEPEETATNPPRAAD
jgi:hypothetical protein